MNRLLEAIKDPYKEHEQEKRRGLEISAGFVEKLSALNAASFAVAASIVLAIKSEHPDVTRTVFHEILIVVVMLWVSFVLAILHYFLAAVVAQLEAAYTETDFVVAQTKLISSTGVETIDDATASQAAAQLEDVIRKRLRPNRRILAKATQLLYPTANIMGSLSMLSFLVAYTLVMVYLSRLW